MKAVTYTRVSSKEQLKEGFSIPAQRKLLHAYARDHAITIAEEFSDDESAKRTGRSDFTRMLTYLRKHESVRTILVEKTDRLLRNLRDYVTLDELGVDIHLVKENDIVGPNSHSSKRLMHLIKVGMARNYIENLSEEVKKGMHEKASEGGYPTVAPLGYLNTRDSVGIRPDPERAPIIRELFDAASTGCYSIDDLTRLARSRSLTGRSRRPIAKSKIAFILRNTVYTGIFTWGGITYRGRYEPIIPPSLFDEVQRVLDGKSRPRGQKRTFTFSGLLRCHTCGGMLTGELKKGRYVYYSCRGSKDCKKHYPETTIEEHTIALLRTLELDRSITDWMLNELASWYDERHELESDAAARLAKRRSELEQLRRTAYEDKLLGTISEEQWREHDERWKNDIAEINARVGQPDLSRRTFLGRVGEALELAQSAANQYLRMDSTERARLLKSVCSNYTLAPGSISVSMRSPFDALARAAESGDWLGDRESNPD